MQGEAGRVTLDFAGQNELQKVHASERVRLTQRSASAATEPPQANTSTPQDFALTAPAIDFLIAKGRLLDRAVTSGAPEITIFPASASPGNTPPAQRTVITAGKFEAR